jgi:hypothetical protein
MSDDRDAVRREFHDLVNMAPKELETWLDTDESWSVGATPDGGTTPGTGGAESVGHASGRRIVELLRTRRDDLRDDDYAHMRTVRGYIHRHLAQRPGGDVEGSRWRFSLMNWGHDPLR